MLISIKRGISFFRDFVLSFAFVSSFCYCHYCCLLLTPQKKLLKKRRVKSKRKRKKTISFF